MIGQVDSFLISLLNNEPIIPTIILEEKIERHQLSDWVVRLVKETPVTIIELNGIEPQRTTQRINGKEKRVYQWHNKREPIASLGRLPNWLFEQIRVTPKQWDRYRMSQENLSYQFLEYDTREEAIEAMGYALCSHIRKLVYET
jgi:hypothetical protein